jgi:hypothetical protein
VAGPLIEPSLDKSSSKKVAASLFILQGGAEPLSSVPVWAEPSQLLIGMWPTTEALACLCIPSERAILAYIRGQEIENEEKYTHDAGLDGGDNGYSACG